jgi:hypothetical protein
MAPVESKSGMERVMLAMVKAMLMLMTRTWVCLPRLILARMTRKLFLRPLPPSHHFSTRTEWSLLTSVYLTDPELLGRVSPPSEPY